MTNWRNARTGVRVRPTAIAAGLLLCAMGCSTTSTIARISQPPIEGRIVGGSPDTIFVAMDSGREYEIHRDDISSIDFPGNVHRNSGVAVLVYGAANIALGLPKCNERTQDKAAFCTGVFLPAGIGLALVVWGLVVEHGQTSAVADTSRPSRLNRSAPSGNLRPATPEAPPGMP